MGRQHIHVESHGQTGGITAAHWPPRPPLLTLEFEDGCTYTFDGPQGVDFPDGLKVRCPHGLEIGVGPPVT